VFGGAIYVEGKPSGSTNDTKVSGCRFENNYAEKNGGAICVNDGLVDLIKSTILNNNAGINGGAIYSKLANTTTTATGQLRILAAQT